MKKLLILFAYFTSHVLCFAQTIENPAFDKCDIPAFHITMVRITKDTTYIRCSYFAEEGSWASISKDTYIRDSRSHETFPLQRCDGLPYSPQRRSFPQNESCELLFCFPSIAGTEQFDFIESEGERAFNIYNVNLKRSYKTFYSDMDLKHISELLSAYESSKDLEKAKMLKDYATSLNNLISYKVSIGNHAEAIRLGTVEVDIRENVFGKEHPSYIESLSNLAKYYAFLGSYDEAIRVGTEVANVIKKVFGHESLNYVNSLENLVSYNKVLRNFTEMVRLQMEVTNIKKIIYGVEHIEYAYSLANLAVGYSDIEDHKEAIRIGTEAIGLLKRIVGTDNPGYITSITNLAYDYFEIGNYTEAIRLETEVTEILKNIKGVEYNYAMSLSTLADYYTHSGNFKEALRLGTEAFEIIKRIVGTNHPEYARSLSNLARLYSSLGNYSKAITLEAEAIEIVKMVAGTNDLGYATSLNNLAGYYQDLGNYIEEKRLLSEAMEIYKRVLGTDNKNYAISLNNLADYNCKVGNYSEAIRLGIEAMDIYKKVLGTEHPLYALSLSNLANCYSNIGNYSKAISLVTEAMELYKRVLGTEHPNYAASLNILAINKSKLGNYSEAIRWGTEAMEIYKRNFGDEHPDYARSLNSLAGYNSQIENYSEAIKLGTEAMEIRKRVLGIEHPLYATSLLNLAGFNSEVGNYSEAIRLESEALEIIKGILGTGHPYHMTALFHLAWNNIELENNDEAFNYLHRFLNYSQSYVMHNFNELSSRNRESMWMNKYAHAYLFLLPYLVTKYPTKQSISELYNKSCLFAKGILLNTSVEMQKMILEGNDPVILNKYNALVANINIYNNLLKKPIKERFMNADSLNRVIEKQEMELARESKAYGDYTHNLTISWNDVQRRLGDNDIAIEFLNFPTDNSGSIMYVALTLKKGYDGPHMVPLFEYKQLKAIPEDSYYTKTDVSDLVWKPLEEELGGVKNIYFAPSGELHRIGIEYLPISKTENVSEVYSIHRLSSTRQLAVVLDETEGKNTILYGGLDYDEKSNAISADSVSTKEPVLRSAFSRANVDSLSLRSSFDFLEGTKKEADMIAEDMKEHRVPYFYYSGIDGTEESFKNLDGTNPKVMHIATHGFYFTEEETEKSKFARPTIELVTEESVDRPIEDKPMTRSGLLFSGCNRALRHEQIPEGEEDGILTAQEIAMLDLRGLDLVVLSACQTGLGDVVSGEGVFGLQRGFKKAGAKTILMSLDKVNDEATRILMVEFYRNLMNGKTKYQSLKDAQKHLRQVENGKYDDPKYWASFIMLDGLN